MKLGRAETQITEGLGGREKRENSQQKKTLYHKGANTAGMNAFGTHSPRRRYRWMMAKVDSSALTIFQQVSCALYHQGLNENNRNPPDQHIRGLLLIRAAFPSQGLHRSHFHMLVSSSSWSASNSVLP